MAGSANQRASVPRPPPEGSAVEIAPDPHGLTARLVGEADVASEYAFRLALDSAVVALIDLRVDQEEDQSLVIDITDLTFCDVRGLTVLVDTVTAGRRAGATVTVVGANDGLRRLWRILVPKLPFSAS